MKRFVALVMALPLSSMASADAGPFPNYFRPVTITLTVDRSYPDYEIFLVGHFQGSSAEVKRVSLSPSDPLVFRSEEVRSSDFEV